MYNNKEKEKEKKKMLRSEIRGGRRGIENKKRRWNIETKKNKRRNRRNKRKR